MKGKIITILLLLTASMAGLAKGSDGLKSRLVVCTDIAPADVEPDDMESMVRLMAYADCFEIEALITSVGWNCDPYPVEWAQYLHRVIEAYRQDVPNLMKRSEQQTFLPIEQENGHQKLGYWPSADYLKGRAVMGSQRGGIKVIGEGNDSPGSDLLIKLADEADECPIYVAAWGGANTLAQAIWRVKQARTAEELKRIVRKFRIYTITDQDMQYNYIKAKAGDTIQLDASKSTDPDGDGLTFLWWLQPEIGKAELQIATPTMPTTTIKIPQDSQGRYHLICEVHDDGPHHLVAYRRVIIDIGYE